MQPTAKTERSAQKNKRLSNQDRSNILAFAKRKIIETEDSTPLDAAYEAAADAIHAVVVQRWPQKDMRVLERYGVAAPDACVYISTGGYNYDRFNFRDGDKRIALRPSQNCNRHPLLLDGETEEVYDAYKAADKAAIAARAARVNDFKALIWGAQTFNALAEAWPAVEALRTTIVGTPTALTVLSDEVISRVKADAAFLAEAA